MSEETTYFEIDTDWAKIVVDGKTTMKVNAKEFTDALYGNDIGMLPPAIRWISDSSPWVLLLERPPQTLNLLCADDSEVKLPLPWTLWLMEVSTSRELTCSVFARMDALYSFEEPLFHLPLPGVDDTGEIEGFTHTLQSNEAIGYQLPEAIDAAYRFMGAQVTEENKVNYIPNDWDATTAKQLVAYWGNLSPLDIMENPFQKVEELTVGELVERGASHDRPDSVFDLMERITTHIHEQGSNNDD